MIVGCTLDYYIIHVLFLKVTTKGKGYYIKIKNKTKNKTKKQKNKIIIIITNWINKKKK